jgi:hypothetical protein
MQPRLEDYKILKLEGTYFALTPYDLFTMPALKITGNGWLTLEGVRTCIQMTFESDTREYERLKARGRSFPDND